MQFRKRSKPVHTTEELTCALQDLAAVLSGRARDIIAAKDSKINYLKYRVELLESWVDEMREQRDRSNATIAALRAELDTQQNNANKEVK